MTARPTMSPYAPPPGLRTVRAKDAPRHPTAVPRMLSPLEIAGQLSVSVKTVSRWIKSGELKAHRLGRQWRVSEGEVKHFISQRNG